MFRSDQEHALDKLRAARYLFGVHGVTGIWLILFGLEHKNDPYCIGVGILFLAMAVAATHICYRLEAGHRRSK